MRRWPLRRRTRAEMLLTRMEAEMPLTRKGKKILSSMRREYGKKKGTSVFYASANAGRIRGVEGRRKRSGRRGR